MTKLGDFLNKSAESTQVDEAENLHVDETAKAEERIIGKIIKVSDEGWGFISSKEIKFTRIFFHWTSLKQDTLRFTELKNGMKVEFTPVEIPEKGWRAIRIRVIPNEPKPQQPEPQLPVAATPAAGTETQS